MIYLTLKLLLVIHYPDGDPILYPETAAGKNQPFSTYVNGQHPSIVDTFYGSSELVKDLIHHGKKISTKLAYTLHGLRCSYELKASMKDDKHRCCSLAIMYALNRLF
jgi:hypothetical protein